MFGSVPTKKTMSGRFDPSRGQVVELIAGPDQLASSVVGVLYVRAQFRKDVKLLGFDLRKLDSTEFVGDIAHSVGCGFTSVGPSRPSGEHQRIFECRLFSDDEADRSNLRSVQRSSMGEMWYVQV